MSSGPVQYLLTRHKGALDVYPFVEGKLGIAKPLVNEPVRQCRLSSDGHRLAYSLADKVLIAGWENDAVKEICRVPIVCVDFCLSPSGRYLATFEKLLNDGTKQHLNMTIWRVDNSKPSSLGAFCHKTQNTWMPQWTSDESHIARQVSNEVLFYKAEVLDRVAFRIAADNIGAFALSSGAYPKAAVFIKEAKGLPAAVKVFLLPSTSAPVAQKMFFKADRCSLHWSPSGKHLLAMAQTDVDSTGVSYYGETHLYFISGDGSFDCRVELDKEGPIHDFTWSPRSDEFIVCYGYMPGKTMLFDNKCNPIFEFPVGSKNHVRWNSQGSLVAFGGFGNLAGHVEVWSRSGAIRRVGHFQSQGAAICEFSPNGAALLTAVLTPRLRVDNSFKVWNWDGTLIGTTPYGELYSAMWRTADTKLFPPVDVSKVPNQASGPLNTEAAAKKEVYRPPGLRNRPSPTPTPVVSVTPAKAAPIVHQPSTLSKEEKAVRRLKEKLDQIVQLKTRLAAGESLELNQKEKITKEDDVRREYEQALIALETTNRNGSLK